MSKGDDIMTFPSFLPAEERPGGMSSRHPDYMQEKAPPL